MHPPNARRLFDARALYLELDRMRRDLELSSRDVSRAVGVSMSTITGLENRAELETDGVLRLARWLGRSIESFSPEGDNLSSPATNDQLPDVAVRFNTKALYAALDAQRKARSMTWRAVADEVSATVPVTVAILTHLKQGGRIGLNRMLAITRWLGARVETFTEATE